MIEKLKFCLKPADSFQVLGKPQSDVDFRINFSHYNKERESDVLMFCFMLELFVWKFV